MMVEMGSRHLVSSTLLRLGKDKSPAGELAAFETWPSCGLGLSGHVGGFRGFWASLKLQRHWVPTRRWLLTLGLISLTFLVFFTAVLSRQSLARRSPSSRVVCNCHTYSRWSILSSCSRVRGPSSPSPCTGGLEDCGRRPSALCLWPRGSHGLQ